MLIENWSDENGNPAGGIVEDVGISISWQNGPLNRGKDRLEPNGAFVENVIKAAIARIEFYEESKFNSPYNRDALEHLRMALSRLEARTADREKREVEGTHEV